jgi:hypothetical protein
MERRNGAAGRRKRRRRKHKMGANFRARSEGKQNQTQAPVLVPPNGQTYALHPDHGSVTSGFKWGLANFTVDGPRV